MCIRDRVRNTNLCWWVSPFGNRWIKACLSAPQRLSQITTSFIASDCQGIHRVRLVTWPYNPKQSNKLDDQDCYESHNYLNDQMNSKGCFESIAIHISYDCFQSKLESVSARIFIKRPINNKLSISCLNQFSLNLDSTLLKNKENHLSLIHISEPTRPY